MKILIEGHKLDQVEQFVYLGSLVTEDGRCTKEVQRRIQSINIRLIEHVKTHAYIYDNKIK